jgi:hypothetical protein
MTCFQETGLAPARDGFVVTLRIPGMDGAVPAPNECESVCRCGSSKEVPYELNLSGSLMNITEHEPAVACSIVALFPVGMFWA